MDLLKKIQYNQELSKASALLLQVLLTTDEADEVTMRLNTILAECANQQICRQARVLLQQLELRLSAQNYAKFTAPFGNYFIGMSADHVQLQEALFQHPERGWGILFKNYRLWQIWIKKDKTFIQSLWSDTLEELSPWLAEKYNEVLQEELARLAFLEAEAEKEGKTTSSNAEEDNIFNQEFKFSMPTPSASASSEPQRENAFSIPTSEPIGSSKNSANTANDALQISPDSIQLLASVLAAQLKGQNADHQNIQQTMIEQLPSLHNLHGASATELIKELELAQNIAKQQEKMQQLKAKAEADLGVESLKNSLPNIQPNSQAIPSSPLSDSLEIDFEMDFEEQAPAPSSSQYSDTKAMRAVANDFSDVELDFNFDDSTNSNQKANDAISINQNSNSPQIEIRMSSAHPKKESMSNLMQRANASSQHLADAINRSIEHHANQAEIRKNEKPVETWNCNFDLNNVDGMVYNQVQLSQYTQHLNLLSCDIDMKKIQHSPVYMVENMDHQNHFKYYTFVFAAENPHQAVDLINKLAKKHQEQLAHIAQTTWKEFKNQAFELSKCCQLYHTSHVIVKASSLYSHISESLISKQQMIVINEAEATKVTPLLLLQESHRFRIIHGQQRLALGCSANKMYPCMVLSRNSGVTWQMIREQLKFLPSQVGVYELLDALRYAAEREAE